MQLWGTTVLPFPDTHIRLSFPTQLLQMHSLEEKSLKQLHKHKTQGSKI